MPTFKLTLAYDGTSFVGWQRQARGISVQGLLEDALRALDGADVTVHGAGRTDAGVHALGQVASFALTREIEAGSVMRALNSQLPDAVRVVAAEQAGAAFHARHDARGKTYRYRILNSDLPDVFERAYAWHLPGPLNVPAMQDAARLLEGAHDFAAFQASGATTKTSSRALSKIVCSAAEARQGGRLIAIDVIGAGFLRHMVRIIVGSLVEVGRGRRDAAWLGEVLARRDRTLAGPTAPPSGLFLVDVEYPPGALADEP